MSMLGTTAVTEEPLTGWPLQSLSENNYYMPYTSNIYYFENN